MATSSEWVTGTVTPGAVANPVLAASAGKAVRKSGPAGVQLMPSGEENSWMRNPAALLPPRYFSTLYETCSEVSAPGVLFTNFAYRLPLCVAVPDERNPTARSGPAAFVPAPKL